MSDQPPWLQDTLIAPKKPGDVRFAPWFAPAQQSAQSAFNDWDLKRDAALEQARLAEAARLAAQAQARREQALQGGQPPPAVFHSLSEQQLQEVRDQALAQGMAQGREALAQELAQERAQQAALLHEVLSQWQGFRANSAAWLEPLKRLSLAVGEQLARAHLSLHPGAVNDLIESCAQALGETRQRIRVHVNPDDLKRLGSLNLRADDDWQWLADPRLGVGSVRLSTDDTEVEDLLSHRLAVLSQQLFDPHLPQDLNDQTVVAAADQADLFDAAAPEQARDAQ